MLLHRVKLVSIENKNKKGHCVLCFETPVKAIEMTQYNRLGPKSKDHDRVQVYQTMDVSTYSDLDG